jgi:hypothetical protein
MQKEQEQILFRDLNVLLYSAVVEFEKIKSSEEYSNWAVSYGVSSGVRMGFGKEEVEKENYSESLALLEATSWLQILYTFADRWH